MKTIQIAGGGLAGLTLGIGLRQLSIPVTVWEAGSYPRHRVCGEFISGRGHGVLARLGLWPLVLETQPRLAQTVAFFSTRRSTPVRDLPEPAICIERYVLDNLLAKRFRELGGELREKERWKERSFPPGVICAIGRQIQHAETPWHWFGLKAHFRHIELTADLEMHLASSGYVGLCRLNDGQVNACGLFRRRAHHEGSAGHWLETLRGKPGSVLRSRFEKAELDEKSFCAVAGLSLAPRCAQALAECRVGDALTMISPITGNGMSMAFESAEFAIAPLAAYSREELSWEEAKKQVALQCDTAFRRRLTWAWQLQRALFQPLVPRVLFSLLGRSEQLWFRIFEKTR